MMSRCYPGALRQNLKKMSSMEEETSALATTGVTQEEMDQLVSPISHAMKSMGNQAFPLQRKRKKLEALAEVFALDTASLKHKRRREIFPATSSSPTGVDLRGTSHYKKNGGRGDSGEPRRKTQFNRSLLSSGLSLSISPPSPSTEGVKVISGRNALSVAAHGDISAQGSGLANQSTVTTSSTKEEEESTSLYSFGHTSNVPSEIEDTVNLISTIQAVGIGSIGSRQTGATHNHHEKRASKHARRNQTQRSRRKLGIRDRQPDGEVVSPISKSFATLTAHDAEVDRVFGSEVRDVDYGESSGKTETTCVLNSGCSSVEAGMRERARRATDYGNSIRQCDDSSELVHSCCSRELHSIVTGPGLSSCSDSIPSGLVTPYQPYRPMEPSRLKGLVMSQSIRNSVTVDAISAANGTFTTNEYKGKNFDVTLESCHAPSHTASRSASEQEAEISSSPTMECKVSGGHAHLQIEGGENLAPTFVLSSGRMSQDEAKKLGLRPSTIEHDFDEYFAQLML